MFEPFFTTKQPGKNSGLGLSTVASIMKRHHGLIDVQSSAGKGAAFRLFFPIMPAEAEEAVGWEDRLGREDVEPSPSSTHEPRTYPREIAPSL